MKIVFDKCVPRPLRGQLAGHEILTAEEMNWGELENGDLIRAAERQFDAIITSDQQWKYQQNLSARKLAIVVLPMNYQPAVLELFPKICVASENCDPAIMTKLNLKNDDSRPNLQSQF